MLFYDDDDDNEDVDDDGDERNTKYGRVNQCLYIYLALAVSGLRTILEPQGSPYARVRYG